MSKRTDYGIDAPRVLAMFFVLGILCPVLGIFARPFAVGEVTVDFGYAPQITGGIFLLEGVLMFVYVRLGQFRRRDGAAKRLTAAHAVGIDIWSTKDLSGNATERTQSNIEMDGAGAQVELRTEDASQMTFPDGSFDVLSILCVHNIPKRAWRVLRPGSVAVFSDRKLTGEYAAVFSVLGFSVDWRGPFWRDVFPPLKMFVARKPS
jgi:arsenite methyltransferase